MKLNHRGLITISLCQVHRYYHANGIGEDNEIPVIPADDLIDFDFGSRTADLVERINVLMIYKRDVLDGLL